MGSSMLSACIASRLALSIFLSLFVLLFLCVDPPVPCSDLLLILSPVPLAITFFSCYITFFISFFYFYTLLLLRCCSSSSSSLARSVFSCWWSFTPFIRQVSLFIIVLFRLLMSLLMPLLQILLFIYLNLVFC